MFRLIACAVLLLMLWCHASGQEVSDCSDPLACNYTSGASGDGPCEYCTCTLDTASFFTLSIEEHATDIIEGHTTYRIYLNATDPTDVVSAVFGSDVGSTPFRCPRVPGFTTTRSVESRDPTSTPSCSASYSNWRRIAGSPLDQRITAKAMQSPPSKAPTNLGLGSFAAGSSLDGNDFAIDDIAGGGWYVLGTSPNGIAGENQRVLLMQVTTAGTLEGVLNVQIFPLGDGDVRNTYAFSGEGVYFDDSLPACGCTDSTACNYDAAAESDDGSCTYPPTGYACDGSCLNDENENGICDELEVLGCSYIAACNFNPFASGDDGSCVFPVAGYNCDGDCLFDLDGDGVCDQNEVTGCQDSAACNYMTPRRRTRDTAIIQKQAMIAPACA